LEHLELRNWTSDDDPGDIFNLATSLRSLHAVADSPRSGVLRFVLP
jgi:hypothetical protein